MAYDLQFFERTPFLFPHKPGAAHLVLQVLSCAAKKRFRNGTLQAAYLMLAARSLGLDCEPDVRRQSCRA